MIDQDEAIAGRHLRGTFSRIAHARPMGAVFNHITVRVDNSQAAQREIHFSREFARDGGFISFCGGPEATESCRVAEWQSQQLGIRCDRHVLEGDAVAALLKWTHMNASDAIVIGTRDGTADGLQACARIPVISVHEDDILRSGPIAVAFDASHSAEAALTCAISMARARALALLIVHVGVAPTGDSAMRTMLLRAAERAGGDGVKTEVVLRQAVAADQLLAAADDQDCCAIVIGTGERSSAAGLILGGVTAAVIERAQVPVITVRRAA